jgi:8-oxo-dGTP pyrophosphatase MutT (NUDIX family)
MGRDAEMNCWTLPGGAVDPEEQPADAAVRECFEETALLVKLDALIGIFGGPEFLISYPNGDGGLLHNDGFSRIHCGRFASSRGRRVF